jgi:hypothetical protein
VVHGIGRGGRRAHDADLSDPLLPIGLSTRPGTTPAGESVTTNSNADSACRSRVPAGAVEGVDEVPST